MVAETRQLIFRPPEVVQAVKEYHRRRGNPLPAGAVVSCHLEGDGAETLTSFRIVLELDAPPKQSAATAKSKLRELVIDATTLAAALILHCRDRRIPLPVSARKSLLRYNDNVCLLVTMSARQETASEAISMRI